MMKLDFCDLHPFEGGAKTLSNPALECNGLAAICGVGIERKTSSALRDATFTEASYCDAHHRAPKNRDSK